MLSTKDALTVLNLMTWDALNWSQCTWKIRYVSSEFLLIEVSLWNLSFPVFTELCFCHKYSMQMSLCFLWIGISINCFFSNRRLSQGRQIINLGSLSMKYIINCRVIIKNIKLLLIIKYKYSHITLTYSLLLSLVVTQLEPQSGTKPSCFPWSRGNMLMLPSF